ncbi:MAG: preprotein translocase subunit SecY [Actinomycetota bacterium]|nr:preprotein translocase subunit SecY [Actinomycetota bacterium]
MLESLRNLGRFVKVPDLRNKVLFTIGVVALYQIGANVTVPGVSFKAVQQLETQAKAGGILGFLNLFSGGGLTKIAVFGLGIMPYITSSIIIQLLSGVIPRFMEWRDQGAVGQKKLTQATRYLTVLLALAQSTGLAYAFHSGLLGILQSGGSKTIDLIPDFTLPRVAFIVLTLTAGTAFVMWLGELITQRGIGQGMSILIFASVVAGIPYGGGAVLAQGGALKLSVLILVAIALIVAIVFVENGQRRIPVTFARRVVGRRMYGGSSTYIPLKVNQAGVIPIIFASSILYIPLLATNIIPWTGLRSWVNNNLVNPINPTYIILYFFLIVAFTFFYVQVTFDPHQQADIIRKQGGYIPGIRPGQPTVTYLSRILNRITFPGSLFLALVAVVPSILLAWWHINQYPFAGTTLLIAAGVSLETLKQIDSQLMMRNYEGFLQ